MRSNARGQIDRLNAAPSAFDSPGMLVIARPGLGERAEFDGQPKNLRNAHCGVRCPARASEIQKRMFSAIAIEQVDAVAFASLALRA